MHLADVFYKGLIAEVLGTGEHTEGRNGTCISSFGSHYFQFTKAPLVSWRKINHMLGIYEMQGFLEGAVKAEHFPHPSVVKWWEPFTMSGGLLGKSYGAYLSKEIPLIIDSIKKNPASRRHVFSCWNNDDMRRQVTFNGLPNCHSTVGQFKVSNNNTLHYQTYQRSADILLGLPFNWIQHWALLEFVAKKTNLQVGKMHYILGDAHIYTDHLKEANQITQGYVDSNDLALIYNPLGKVFKAEDFSITGSFKPVITNKLSMRI